MTPTTSLRGLTVEDARARMLAAAAPLGVQSVELDAALGRVLAQPLAARRDQPPFDASAMDGWAVRRADAAPGAQLSIVGESAAGKPFSGQVGPGQAARIFTGAPVPAGADFVIIQEDATALGSQVRINAVDGGSNIRPRGGDLGADTLVLEAGVSLDPWRISLAAAAGHESLPVFMRPRIAILTNGEELCPPGQAPLPWQIHDSGGPGLAALVRLWGAEPMRLTAVGDDSSAIAGAIGGAEADLIVAIGGASVGDHDLVKPALGALGLQLAVETVNVRPGKPTWFGRLGDGRLVLGLPGNPAAAFVCAELFLKPLIGAFAGRPADPAMMLAALQVDLPANGPREHWMRAILSRDDQGRAWVTPFDKQDSSLVGVFAGAAALLRRRPGAPAIVAGQMAEILQLERYA